MKFSYLILLAAALTFTACQDEAGSSTEAAAARSTHSFAASTDQDTAKYKPLYLHEIPTDLNAQVTHVGQFGQKAPPPIERHEVQVLTKGIWVIEYYVDRQASRAQKIAGTGQWLQFYGDGSFKGGHWGEHTHSGVWYINYTTAKPTIVLDSNVDNYDAWWEIHGITGQQDAMAWRRVGESGFGPYRKGIQIKLMEMTELPTKEQFADHFNF